MSATREIYTIRWVKRAGQWYCPQYGISHRRKAALVQQLAGKLRRRQTFAHVPCQLWVFGKQGRIQFERTYGRDPRRTKG